MGRPILYDSHGRAFPAGEIARMRQLVIRHFSASQELPYDEYLQLATADQVLRTMMLLGVPLEQLAGQDDPRRVAELIRTHGITPQHQREIEYAVQHAAEFVRAWPEDLRDDLKRVTRDAVRARLGGGELAQVLRDRYADRNVDAETVAYTEVALAHNNATIAGQKPGGYVIGMTFPDSCLWCRMNIHGNVLQVVEPPGPHEEPIASRDWDHQIWVGKSNRGRRKYLYEGKTGRRRRDNELWKPCPVPHAQARCSWLPFNPKLHHVDEEGHLQLRKHFLKRTEGTRNLAPLQSADRSQRSVESSSSVRRRPNPETVTAICQWCNRELMVPIAKAGSCVRCQCGASVATPFDDFAEGADSTD